ncbi:DUF2971 domain-containing protein [Tropicimonas sediminicola]|uniref:DUF2971 domain-containing protein n=1 Tax=Tropicimonas sediminicola TaxID=1031541 RepID=A0A239IXQ8_9RHOB|nr:DUF2971 domain-containing protein [Tropicimonas sediminicola]SNS98400.1 hypothetical protein SAMN05421757_1054 [Tropicimonas sediminicola]
MLVFRFLNEKYAIRALREKRLRISRIEELNDEFEFIGLALKGRKDRKALREIRSHLHQKSGIICMSERWSNPLLWAHYADNLRGIALAFEIAPTRFHQVKYVSKRPKLLDLGHRTLDGITPADIKQLMLTKFDAWAYEEERRGFFELREGETISGGTHFFEPFSDQMALRQVIVGPRCSVKRREISEALGDLSDIVESFRARAAFQGFSIVRNRNENIWK